MLCYKDRTFCGFLDCCHKDCDRRLTPDIYKDADQCGLLICKFMEKPDCFSLVVEDTKIPE
jgi:hypothetical protein